MLPLAQSQNVSRESAECVYVRAAGRPRRLRRTCDRRSNEPWSICAKRRFRTRVGSLHVFRYFGGLRHTERGNLTLWDRCQERRCVRGTSTPAYRQQYVRTAVPSTRLFVSQTCPIGKRELSHGELIWSDCTKSARAGRLL